MFDAYKDIFNQRGYLYHKAMTRYPNARIAEFKPLINLLEIRSGDILLDAPSGGCYLQNRIPGNVSLYSIDSSYDFLRHCPKSNHSICANVDKIPLDSSTIDKFYSLAGIHHLSEKMPFFQEAYRLLRGDGIFALADVEAGSPVDRFLNVFVNRFNSMGHEGIFLDSRTQEELESCGFNIVMAKSIPHAWCFDEKKGMIDFFKLLFGLDKASDREIERGIDEYLGYHSHDSSLYVNWELLYIKSQKI